MEKLELESITEEMLDGLGLHGEDREEVKQKAAERIGQYKLIMEGFIKRADRAVRFTEYDGGHAAE